MDIFDTYLDEGTSPQLANVPATMFNASKEARTKLMQAVDDAVVAAASAAASSTSPLGGIGFGEQSTRHLSSRPNGASSDVESGSGSGGSGGDNSPPRHGHLLSLGVLAHKETVEDKGNLSSNNKVKKVLLAKHQYTEPVKEALTQCTNILALVQKEVLLLLEKDTLPRFKASPLFAKYVEDEPLLFQRGGGKI